MMDRAAQYERTDMQHEMGRPTAYLEQSEPMDSTTLRLTTWHRRMARKIGGGSMSGGAREAIEEVAMARGYVDTIKKPKERKK